MFTAGDVNRRVTLVRKVENHWLSEFALLRSQDKAPSHRERDAASIDRSRWKRRWQKVPVKRWMDPRNCCTVLHVK